MSNNGNGLEGLVAIQLSIRFWPGFVKLRPQDLGLDPKRIDPNIIYLGNKKLYPKERRDLFANNCNRARYYLHDNSFAYAVDTVRAIPARNLPRVEARLAEFKAEHAGLVEEFLRDYDEIRSEWKRVVDEKHPGLWKLLEPHYPTPAVLRSKFSFTWRIFNIKAADTPAETSTPEVIEAYENAKRRLQEDYEAMVEEAVVYLRNEVSKSVNNLAGRIRNGKIIKTGTLDNVRNVAAWFEDLNIFGDRNVAASLAKLRTALDGVDPEGLKSNEVLKKEIGGLAAEVAAQAANLEDVAGITGRYKRKIDLS